MMQVHPSIYSENNRHLHTWKFVNSSLLTSRFMGEEGLLSESVELGWKLPLAQGPTLSLSYGEAVDHEHGHGEEHDEHEEEEGEHEEEIHGEESLLNTDIFTASIAGTYLKDDFNHFHYSAHFSKGTNGYGRDGKIYGASLGYNWRQNGQEEGGKSFQLGAEWIKRDIDYASEDGDETGNTTENGYALSTGFDFGNKWEIGARYEHLEGSNILGETPSINRTSLALTRSYTINDQFDGHVRLQYDIEDRDEQNDSNTAWLQFQVNFGGIH